MVRQKSVRIEAARVLARIPDGQFQHDQLASYERAIVLGVRSLIFDCMNCIGGQVFDF
jgi:hypothetical protein